MTMTNLFAQPMNSRRFLVSMARLTAASPGATGQRSSTVSLRASILTTMLLSSRLTNTLPIPSATANSGLPPSSTVPATLPSFAARTVTLLLRPLKAKTRCVTASKMIASGFLPVSTVPTVLSVFSSKMVTLLPWPLLIKPRPRSGATAMPCTPLSPVMLPITS